LSNSLVGHVRDGILGLTGSPLNGLRLPDVLGSQLDLLVSLTPGPRAENVTYG
jgi:hypothetical protein